jgi:hypothetical protein
MGVHNGFHLLISKTQTFLLYILIVFIFQLVKIDFNTHSLFLSLCLQDLAFLDHMMFIFIFERKTQLMCFLFSSLNTRPNSS